MLSLENVFFSQSHAYKFAYIGCLTLFYSPEDKKTLKLFDQGFGQEKE